MSYQPFTLVVTIQNKIQLLTPDHTRIVLQISIGDCSTTIKPNRSKLAKYLQRIEYGAFKMFNDDIINKLWPKGPINKGSPHKKYLFYIE
jgi:hypothetical protein